MDNQVQIAKIQTLEYLARERIAVLSTHADDSGIDAAAVYFLADKDFNFYFTTKVGTRKYRNMTNNPQVTLTVADADMMKTVEVRGTASLVTDMTKISEEITMLINKNKFEGIPWASPIAKLDAGQYAIIMVKPSWLRFGTFVNEEPRGEYFKQII